MKWPPTPALLIFLDISEINLWDIIDSNIASNIEPGPTSPYCNALRFIEAQCMALSCTGIHCTNPDRLAGKLAVNLLWKQMIRY